MSLSRPQIVTLELEDLAYQQLGDSIGDTATEDYVNKLEERVKLLEDTLTKVYDNYGDTDFIIDVVGDIFYPDTN